MSVRFEDVLARDGRLVYTSVGTSMLPMLRPKRDILIIERPKGPLQRYDVPLYRRDSGKTILHRIVKVRPEGYVLCGDNQRRREPGVTDRQIIGVLTAFVRDGREIRVTDRGYRLYVRVWCGLFWLRAGALWSRDMAGRAKRKLRRVLSGPSENKHREGKA